MPRCIRHHEYGVRWLPGELLRRTLDGGTNQAQAGIFAWTLYLSTSCLEEVEAAAEHLK